MLCTCGHSSVGRAVVLYTTGHRFESYCPHKGFVKYPPLDNIESPMLEYVHRNES